MDNVFWVALIPFLISVVAGVVTTPIVDGSRRKTVFYSIITKQPKTRKKEHTISTLFIWCDKYHVITEDDIDMDFPPCIEIDGNHEIYGAEVIRELNSPNFNRASIEKTTHKCNLSFKQFDYNNVIILNVFHSGGSLKFIGNINASNTKNIKMKKLSSVAKSGIVFFTIGLALYFLMLQLMKCYQDSEWIYYLVFVYFFMFIILCFIWTILNLNFASIPKAIKNHLKYQKHKTK